MKVTSKTLYTLHFLCALSLRSKENPARPVHLREIASEFSIPFKFLEQIAILMKSVGFVRGARGKAGGYQLAESPENITLSRVLKATEGEIFPTAEIEGGHPVVQNLIQETIQECRALVDKRLEAITLQDIAEKARHLLEPAPMYYV